MSDGRPWVARPAVPSDYDAVVTIQQQSFTAPSTKAALVAELANPDVAFLWVVGHGGDGPVVGFCAFWRVVDELHINNVAVAPDERRGGAGRALLEAVLAEGRRLGAFRATLEVRRSNGDALRVYERLGFVLAGVRREYYSQPVEDALVLWREDRAGS